MSVNATNPVQGFQNNVTNLESVASSAAGVRASLQEQFRQDQEAMVAALTGAFQRTMQTPIAESEARNKIVTDGLRTQVTSLRSDLTRLTEENSCLKTNVNTLAKDYLNHGHWHANTSGVCRLPQPGHDTGGYKKNLW